MKILIVSGYYKPAYIYGGPTKSLSALCEGMVRQGAKVMVFTTNANGNQRLDAPLNTPVAVDGVTVHYFPLAYNGLGFFYAPTMRQPLARQVTESDLVVIETIWGHQLSLAAQACRKHHKPCVVAVRGQLFDWSLGSKKLKKRLYLHLVGRRHLQRAAALHCTDPVEAAAVDALRLGPPTFVVSNGIDTTPFRHMPERGYWRRLLRIDDEAPILLYLGRLTRIKRPDIAVATLAACHTVRPDTHLILAGPDQDGMSEALVAQARQAGCATHLHITGLLDPDQVRCALTDADLLVAPSEIQENFGMAAAEALAAGVPVLVSTGIPVGIWAQKYHAGRMADVDADSFGHAATELLADMPRLASMGVNGRQAANACFDINAVSGEMLRHYRSIVESGVPAPLSGEN